MKVHTIQNTINKEHHVDVSIDNVMANLLYNEGFYRHKIKNGKYVVRASSAKMIINIDYKFKPV